MPDFQYDFLVIGAGPAGEAAAMSAAKNGLKVGVVDDQGLLGGNCTHKGTIPSKSLRHAVKQVIHFRKQPEVLQMSTLGPVSYPAILEASRAMIPRKVAMHKAFTPVTGCRCTRGTRVFRPPRSGSGDGQGR